MNDLDEEQWESAQAQLDERIDALESRVDGLIGMIEDV